MAKQTSEAESLEVTPKELEEIALRNIQAGYPFIVVGPPGVGKSNIIEDACRRIGAECVVSHPVVDDPTDAKGYPWIAEDHKSATHVPFGNLARVLKAKKKTVWFLDDLGQAMPAVQASYMQPILTRRSNGHIIPACVSFAAATNRRTDRSGVSGILEAVKSRFKTIIHLRPEPKDWYGWAVNHGIAAEVIAYLRSFPKELHDFQATVDMTNSPCPRTWENLSDEFKLGYSAALEFKVFAGCIGQGAAGQFLSYLKMLRESDLFNLDEILLNPATAKLPPRDKVSALYALSTGLAYRATKDNLDRVLTYVVRMDAAGMTEFATLVWRDAVRREPSLSNTPAGIRFMSTTDIGKMMMGEFN